MSQEEGMYWSPPGRAQSILPTGRTKNVLLFFMRKMFCHIVASNWTNCILLFVFCFLFFFFFCFVFFFFLLFSRPHPWNMEVPRLGVESELKLPAYTTATAMQDLSHIYNLHGRSWQHQILNPLIEARDQTCILTETSRFISTVPQWELPVFFP